MKHYTPTDKSLFFTKNDPKDQRLGDCVVSTISDGRPSGSIAVVGYPDDEGIKNNGGRLGAALAPAKIREFFYKMTPHLLEDKTKSYLDLGDLKIEGTLSDRQTTAKDALKEVFHLTNKVITLGGGNDYSYPDGAAFLESFKNSHKEKPLVINFDAHLDARPFNGTPTSGTPFYQLLTDYSEFDFLEIGIQSQCNSKEHLKWVKEKGAKVLTYDEMMFSGESQSVKILEFMEPYLLKKRSCFVSVDIDGFSSKYAPGCSQSFATGFDVENFLTVFKVLTDRLEVNLLGIYEVSPPLDIDNRTAKLATQIMHLY